MRVVGVSYRSDARTARTMGNPIAYLGGIVDAAPERAETIVVGHDVLLTLTVEDLDVEALPGVPIVADVLERRGVVALPLEFGRGRRTLEDLYDAVRHYDHALGDALETYVTAIEEGGTG